MLHATIDKQTCTCPALGISTTADTDEDPILILCRKLDAAGYGDEALTVSRNGTPAVHVSSIRQAARRTVVENKSAGPRFGRFRPFSGNAQGRP